MKALRDVFGDTLVSLGWTNPNVVVLDADLANSTKADKFAMAYPDRFLQMGIAEQNFVGVAVGLASLGFVPWLSTFTVFFTHRALDPIRMLVAQTHANVKIGAAYSGLLTGLTGKTHQDVQDIAIMRAMPDMTVLAPADAIEGEAIIRWATEFQGPVYLRLARDASPNVFDEKYSFVPGKTILLREGSDVLMISTGPQSIRCLQAAELLQGRRGLRRGAACAVDQAREQGGNRQCGRGGQMGYHGRGAHHLWRAWRHGCRNSVGSLSAEGHPLWNRGPVGGVRAERLSARSLSDVSAALERAHQDSSLGNCQCQQQARSASPFLGWDAWAKPTCETWWD